MQHAAAGPSLSMFKKVPVSWKPAFRIVPTRFPTIYLYDRVANQADFDVLNRLEAMTNPRLRDEVGELALVPEAERLFGAGCGPIMAAFTHLNPAGSRFSDGSYGVFYAAKERATAIAETRYHSELFLLATKESAMHLQMRLYHVKVQGEVADLHGYAKKHADIVAPDSYGAAQAVGKTVRASGAHGLIYPSVRAVGGSCVAAFRTRILKDCRHASYLEYHWDGTSINYITEQLQ